VAHVVAESQQRTCPVLRNQAEDRPLAGRDPRPSGVSHPVGELHAVKAKVLAPELALHVAIHLCGLPDQGDHHNRPLGHYVV
jgi:hypothetical protein